jgi:hypothetical protein
MIEGGPRRDQVFGRARERRTRDDLARTGEDGAKRHTGDARDGEKHPRLESRVPGNRRSRGRGSLLVLGHQNRMD